MNTEVEDSKSAAGERLPGKAGGAKVALAVACCALLLSLGAATLSALIVTGVVKTPGGATVAPSGPLTGSPSGQEEATTDTGGAEATAPPPSEPAIDSGNISPAAEFELAYPKKALRAQPACSPLRWVDVDEPRVGAEETKGEFTVRNDCGTASTSLDLLDEIAVATATSPDATAKDCAEAIASGPTNEPLVPTAGMNYCLQTSRARAAEEGIDQKIVLVTVSSIAKDGTLNLLVTAWRAPV